MKTKTYRYHGPDTTVELKGLGKYRLVQGKDLELPSEPTFVRGLLAKRLLTEVSPPSDAPKAEPAPPPSDDKNVKVKGNKADTTSVKGN